MKLRVFLGILFVVVLLAGAWGGPGISATPAPSMPADALSQVTQFGITWTFDREYECGRFANGDYWVVGPVTITAISPASVLSGTRTMNGSMINPSPENGLMQGYDSAMYAGYGPDFDEALNVARPNGQDLSPANPLTVPPDSSLVSTISVAETGVRAQLQTAAILTVLDAPAPEGSFRPPYSGSDKSLRFNVSQINSALLRRLPPVASTPALADVERFFERPWIDHVPNWLGGYHHPVENMPDYGREIATEVGVGALMLHLDFPYAQKETLLVRYLQLGIDLYGVLQDGGEENWPPNGGHASGRKWPILFAGLMLGDAAMQAVGPGDGSGEFWFGEDGQTFYVTQSDIDMAHDPDIRGCDPSEYMQSDLGLPEWGIVHGTDPTADNKSWCAIYRQCCTANAWDGFLLSALIMDAKSLWAHDAIFDYQDRYMAIEAVGAWTRSWSDFAEEMWDTYRAGYGPVWGELALTGSPANHAIHLNWTISSTLPATSTWRITYDGGGTAYLPLTVISPTRAYTLTGLTNYVWYTVTLDAMLGNTAWLSDTVRVMPTDITVYLPLVMRSH
ncbi:MAG: hypothetical protein JXA21_02510 [Anaerolineae bacterium]|nr:hypothetical protein [Anaerolineae bacterium]